MVYDCDATIRSRRFTAGRHPVHIAHHYVLMHIKQSLHQLLVLYHHICFAVGRQNISRLKIRGKTGGGIDSPVLPDGFGIRL